LQGHNLIAALDAIQLRLNTPIVYPQHLLWSVIAWTFA
jgi:hypothetical protein